MYLLIPQGTPKRKKRLYTGCTSQIRQILETLEKKKRNRLPDLLQPLEVLSELLVDRLGRDLGRLARLPVFLPVEEPVGDLELAGVLDNGHKLLDLVRGHLSGPARIKKTAEQDYIRELQLELHQGYR